ncbi:MAG TPA: hypothetical protein VMW16_11040 [Sedimentisphaerales bacterium]|nr:hypothetical protein [Sedimentisphaerales bacterium]
MRRFQQRGPGVYATIGGGNNNQAQREFATVPGAYQYVAGGNYSFAAGRRASTNWYQSSFVWKGHDSDFAAQNSNHFLINAAAVGIGTAGLGGYKLAVNGSAAKPGGGAPSSDGYYAVSAAIGRPRVGPMAAGRFKISSGFWAQAPVCMVEFHDFARFADQWFLSEIGLPADLDTSGAVDFVDLLMFPDKWLAYCPAGWPLQ